jgi:hypothetical protein
MQHISTSIFFYHVHTGLFQKKQEGEATSMKKLKGRRKKKPPENQNRPVWFADQPNTQ